MLFWIFHQRFSTLLMISDMSDYDISDYVTVSEVPVNRLFAIQTKFYERKCVRNDVIRQALK